MAGGGGGLEKTGCCQTDVEKREGEAEVTLRIHTGEAGNGGAARCEEWGAVFTHTPTQSLPAHPITASRYVTVVGLSHVTSQGEAWEGKGGTAASWRGTAIRGTKAQRHVPRYAQIVWL